MKLPERMAVVETQLKALTRVVWVLVSATLAQVGVQRV